MPSVVLTINAFISRVIDLNQYSLSGTTAAVNIRTVDSQIVEEENVASLGGYSGCPINRILVGVKVTPFLTENGQITQLVTLWVDFEATHLFCGIR